MPRSTIGVDTIPSVGQTYTDHDTVLAVQQALQSKGFDPGPLDGVYGPKTAAAIKKMQGLLGTTQTGKIDYGVLMALQVSAPKSSGQKAVDAQVALDAATAAEHAQSGSELAAAADKVAEAATNASPEVKSEVSAAKSAVAKAKTPSELASAKQQLETAAKSVQGESSFLSREVFAGLNVWQVALLAVGLGAVSYGAFKLLKD